MELASGSMAMGGGGGGRFRLSTDAFPDLPGLNSFGESPRPGQWVRAHTHTHTGFPALNARTEIRIARIIHATHTTLFLRFLQSGTGFLCCTYYLLYIRHLRSFNFSFNSSPFPRGRFNIRRMMNTKSILAKNIFRYIYDLCYCVVLSWYNTDVLRRGIRMFVRINL